MLFWQSLILLSLVAGLFILWPLLKTPFTRSSSNQHIDRDVAQVELFDDHLADLKASLERNEIDQEQFDSLKAELQRNFVSETQKSAQSDKEELNKGGRFVLVGVAVLVPLLSTGLYSLWGAKGELDIYQTIQAHKDNPAKNEEEILAQNRELIMLVRSRLNQKPEDAQLLYRLARMSMDVQDYDESVSAYRRIQALQIKNNHTGQEVAEIAMGLAIAIFVREGNKITEEVRAQTKTAIASFPFMYLANEMGGLIAFQDKRYREAIDHWRRAVSRIDRESPQAKSLISGMQRALGALRAKGEDYDFTKSINPVVDAAAMPTGMAHTEANTTDQADSDSPAIKVSVAIKEGLAISPDDTVFIYVRAWQGAKMPLAIQRMTVAKLPFTVTLDKTMAMAPGMDITSVEQLEVIARVSKTGSAISASGDWQASQGPVSIKDATQTISLLISEQIP